MRKVKLMISIKLTVNDVQLSDLMKTAVGEYQMDINQSVAELH